MIQNCNKNPCSNIFQESPIIVKNKYSVQSFVGSINKCALAIYYHYPNNSFKCFNKSNGEIIIFLQKQNKWVEYFRMENQLNNSIQLLCFANKNDELLFHRKGKNFIERLTINQNKIFGLISYLSESIKIFFQLPFFPSELIPSNDQKLILIWDRSKYLLLDVIQKTIIFTQNGDERNCYQNIHFFNNNYLVFNQNFKNLNQQQFLRGPGMKKLFYNIKNKKVEKILNLYGDSYLEYPFSFSFKVGIQQINCKSVGFFCYRSFNKYVMVIVNMTNFKFIRKISFLVDDPESLGGSPLKFIGISQKYALHRYFNNNQILLHIINLIDLNVEISNLNSDPSQNEQNESYQFCQKILDNQLLMVENQKRKQTCFWLIK